MESLNLRDKVLDEFAQLNVKLDHLVELGRLMKKSEIRHDWQECIEKGYLPTPAPVKDIPKPQVGRTFRHCKDETYRQSLDLLQATGSIKGRAITLGAAHAPEIRTLFSGHIEGKITTCENNRKLAQQLSHYYWRVNLASSYKQVRFLQKNIFQRLAVETDFAIIDLDLNGKISPELINKLEKLLPKCTKQEFLLMLWGSYGRHYTEDEYDFLVRPYIYSKLTHGRDARFDLISSRHFKYNDNRHPMKADALVLEHRAYAGNSA